MPFNTVASPNVAYMLADAGFCDIERLPSSEFNFTSEEGAKYMQTILEDVKLLFPIWQPPDELLERLRAGRSQAGVAL